MSEGSTHQEVIYLVLEALLHREVVPFTFDFVAGAAILGGMYSFGHPPVDGEGIDSNDYNDSVCHCGSFLQNFTSSCSVALLLLIQLHRLFILAGKFATRLGTVHCSTE